MPRHSVAPSPPISTTKRIKKRASVFVSKRSPYGPSSSRNTGAAVKSGSKGGQTTGANQASKRKPTILEEN